MMVNIFQGRHKRVYKWLNAIEIRTINWNAFDVGTFGADRTDRRGYRGPKKSEEDESQDFG